MEITVNQLVKQIDQIEDISVLVTILELTAYRSEVLTISEMARKEGKSPNGIRKSNKYRKINIGGQLMCVKGIRDIHMPF